HLSLSIMGQLTSVNVSVPLNSSEIEQTIESLIQKKKYFIENQDRVTKENIEKVEAEIAAMEENGFGYHKKKGNNYHNNNEKNNKSNNENENDIYATTKEEVKVEVTNATENEKEETNDKIEDPKDENTCKI